MIKDPKVGDRVILIKDIDLGGDGEWSIAGITGETGTVAEVYAGRDLLRVRFDEVHPVRTADNGHTFNVYYHELGYLSDYEINVSLEVDELI